LFGSYGLGGYDEVGFVLAAGVIEDDDELAIACLPGVSATGCGGGAVGDLRNAWTVSGIESNFDWSIVEDGMSM
jgi:hypothetical protein